MTVLSKLFDGFRLNRRQRRKLRLDRIVITGEVVIRQGGKVVARAKNHFVDAGLIELVNLISAQTTAAAPNGILPSGYWDTPLLTRAHMLLGHDTTTPTVHTTTTLADPINTAANLASGLTSNPAAGSYRVTWSSQWNAGTVAGVLGELGLYLVCDAGLNAFMGTHTAASTDIFVVSRLSHADGDFTSFTINEAVPLVVDWSLTFTFA